MLEAILQYSVRVEQALKILQTGMARIEQKIDAGAVQEEKRMAALDDQIAALRAYLRQWIAAPWIGPGIERLRTKVDRLQSREAIEDWLGDALAEDIDPL